MLFEQKSRRKSSVEIAVYPYKSLTRHYFFIKISSMISSASYKTRVRIVFLLYIYNMGQANIFINFSRIFSIHEDVSHEVVMDGRGATTESSLSDGASLQSISAAIEQHHLHKSIFHLLQLNI